MHLRADERYHPHTLPTHHTALLPDPAPHIYSAAGREVEPSIVQAARHSRPAGARRTAGGRRTAAAAGEGRHMAAAASSAPAGGPAPSFAAAGAAAASAIARRARCCGRGAGVPGRAWQVARGRGTVMCPQGSREEASLRIAANIRVSCCAFRVYGLGFRV
jgi:hypothetical protein